MRLAALTAGGNLDVRVFEDRLLVEACRLGGARNVANPRGNPGVIGGVHPRSNEPDGVACRWDAL